MRPGAGWELHEKIELEKLRRSIVRGSTLMRRLISLGRAGRILKRLLSPDLAACIETVKNKFLAKFSGNPRGRSRRSALPPTPEIELNIFRKALHSFPVGAGPRPDGLRADFLKDLVGHSFESLLLAILQHFLLMRTCRWRCSHGLLGAFL